jgi:2-oxoglutarate dehydrogenase E2 component (dihydrolipoamide succinyltransferase)
VILADTEGEERLAVRLMAYLALTYDHRLIDGADAARYLATVKRRLERPDAYVGIEPRGRGAALVRPQP